MLKSLQLNNFQAHKNLKIEFPPGITVIKGPSDVGKSAVLRALRWLALNDMAGEDFITHGEDEVVVVLDTDRGKIVRRKGIENIYKLDGKVLKSFGAGKVPEIVEQALGLGEINFQKQHDSPFWLSDNAGDVSRQLNAVIDLSVIDLSMANAGLLVRTARSRAAVSEERLGEKRRAYEALKEGTGKIKAFKSLKEKFDEHESLKANHDILDGIISDIDSCCAEAWAIREATSKSALEKATAFREAQLRWTNLRDLLTDLEVQATLSTVVPDFSPVEKLWKDLRAAAIESDNLQSLIASLARAEDRVVASEKAAAASLAKFKAFACPECGRKN